MIEGERSGCKAAMVLGTEDMNVNVNLDVTRMWSAFDNGARYDTVRMLTADGEKMVGREGLRYVYRE